MSDPPNEMKRVRSSNEIDLRSWEWFETDDPNGLRDLVAAGFAANVTNVLRKVFDEHPPQLDFPVMWGPDSDGWGGKCPDDPVTLYVSLPLGEEEDDCVIYACSLEGAVDDLIDGHITPSTGKITDDEGQVIMRKVAARLRELADKLDNACVSEEAA